MISGQYVQILRNFSEAPPIRPMGKQVAEQMSRINKPLGVNDLSGAHRAPEDENGAEVRQNSPFSASSYVTPAPRIDFSPPVSSALRFLAPPAVKRAIAFEELYRMLRTTLMDRAPLRPEVAEMVVAGAIRTLSLGHGDGWVRPYVPNEDLMDLMRGGPDAYAQSLSDAYSIYEMSEGTSKQRLFYELRELLYDRTHPLHDLAGLHYGSLVNWIRSSLRNGERVPGGVLSIKLKNESGFTRGVYYISDTHGHADGLWQILNMHVSFNETLLQAMYLDKAVLILGGDGWLPVSQNESSLIRGIISADALLLLLSELPGNFFWTGGNHDPVVRPPEILTGGEKLVEARNAMVNGRGTGFLFDFQQVVDRLPYLTLIADNEEIVAMGGHTPVASITPDMAILSPFDPAIRRMLTFGRLDPAYLDATMGPMRRAMNAPNAAFLAGHIHPRNESRSAFRPYPNSRGMIITRAYGQRITGVRVASFSPTRVVVENFVGDERSRLKGVDLRTEVLKMNTEHSSVLRRRRTFHRRPVTNYAGLPPAEMLIESWIEGAKFLWGKLKRLFQGRAPASNVNIMMPPAAMTAPVFMPPVMPAAPMLPMAMMPFVVK